MRRVVRSLFAALVALAVVPLLVQPWCAADARGWYAGDRATVDALARSVSRSIQTRLSQERFHTGSARFNGEWLFGTEMMAALGFGQIARARNGDAASIANMDRAIELMLGAPARAFDRDAWGADPLASLDGPAAHAAYLGYTNLALSLRRQLDAHAPSAAENDAITEALARRFSASPALLLETYPGEIYPVDNAAAIASIALHDRALGRPRRAVVTRWLQKCRAAFVDPQTGLLYQSLPGGAPRGSGTALAAYFLSFADTALSRDLHRAVQRSLAEHVLGFGVVREYPHTRLGRGDIDSGPLILGYSISASGFALAGCRIHHDPRCFTDLYSTLDLVGAPLSHAGRISFVSGGPLTDAILLAMLTAEPT